MRIMGRVKHEVLYNQAAEIFGRLRKSDFEYIPEKLAVSGQGHVSRAGCQGGNRGRKTREHVEG